MGNLTYQLILSKPHRFHKNHIRVHYPNDYEKILSCIGKTFKEKLYNYFHGNHLFLCPICGKPTKYESIRDGYREYCSAKCAQKSEKTRWKSVQTCLKNWGVPYNSQSPEIKKKIKGSHASKTLKDVEKINKKRKQTCLEKYGVEYVTQAREFKIKKRDTFLKKYGVSNPFSSKKIQDKCHETQRFHNISKIDVLLGYTDDGKWICKCPHPNDCKIWDICDHKYIINCNRYYGRIKEGGETCTKLNPLGRNYDGVSNASSIYFDNLDKYIKGNREIQIGSYNVDWMYKNIIVEYNGSFWHADPSIYKSDWINPINGNTAQYTWDYDKKRKQYIESLGYKIITVWSKHPLDFDILYKMILDKAKKKIK